MPKPPRADRIYIADGLAEDCEDLVLKCSQVSKLSYQKFCDIWKELEFVRIFHGRNTGAELAEFCEEALHVAKHFMVSNIQDYEKSVAGLFLVYAILNLQPYSRFAALRLVQEDVAAIKQLEVEARKERRIDILYILGEVLVKGPCQYHVSERERGLDFSLRKYYEGLIQRGGAGQTPKGVFHRHSNEIPILQEMNPMEEAYHRLKVKGQRRSVQNRSGLHYYDCNQTIEMLRSLKSIVSGVIDTIPTPITPEKKNTVPDSTDHHDNVQSIKMKALKNAVNPMRHLTGVQQRSSEPSTSSAPKNKISPKSKNKEPKSRRKSDTPEHLKSPTRYPWSLKQLFDSSDDEQPTTSKTNKNTRTSSTEDSTKTKKDLFLIELSPIGSDKDDLDINGESKRSPRKITPPKRLRKLDFNEVPKNYIIPKHSLKRKYDALDNSDCQFVELSMDRIPTEISVTNNVEFEIIDQYNASKPSTSKTGIQLSTSKNGVQPSTSKTAAQSSTSNNAVQPTTSKNTEKTATSKNSVEPSTSKKAEKPSTSRKAEKLSTGKKAEKPSTSKKSVEPSSSKKAEKTSTTKKAENPSTSEKTEKPSTSKKAEKPSTSKNSVEPSTSKKAEKTSTTKKAENPSTSEKAEKPSTSKKAEKPSTSKNSVQPSTSKKAEKTSTTKKAEKPSISEKTEKPSTTKKAEKPSTSEKTEKPSTSKNAGKPSPSKNAEKPTTSKDAEKTSTSKEKQPRKKMKISNIVGN